MKDAPLKLRIRRILWAQGYHCPLEVDLSHFDYEEGAQALKRSPITDIDVLGIRFEPDLRISTVVADCKSGHESEPNRLFWLRGVMDFFGAQDGMLVKTVLHSHGRALAPKLGIRVLDEAGLQILEKGLGIESPLAFDIGDQTLYERSQSLWGIDVPAGQKPSELQLRVKDVYMYLQYLYWMVDEYRNVQTIVERFSAVASDLQPSDLRAKYLCYVGLQRFALSMLRLANEVAARDANDVVRQSRAYLFGGPLALREKAQIFELLNRLNEQSRNRDKLVLEPPYFGELVEIVNRLIAVSAHAGKVLLLLDAVLLEHVLGSKRDLSAIMGAQYSTDALVLAKRIATLLQKHSGLSTEVFAELWTL